MSPDLQPIWEEEGPLLVVGAGVLGSRLLELLVSSGASWIRIVDLDVVEARNLGVCSLYSPSDLGRPKALAAAEALRRRQPELRCGWFHGELGDLGEGIYRRSRRVMACLDGRRARLELAGRCRRAAVPLVDGAVGDRSGEARFYGVTGACYACGLTASDHEALSWRQSCSPAARRDPDREQHGGAGEAASDVVARLMLRGADGTEGGRGWEHGRALRWNASTETLHRVALPRRLDCPVCPSVPPAMETGFDPQGRELGEFLDWLGRKLGSTCRVSLGRDWVVSLDCFRCGTRSKTLLPHAALDEEGLVCPSCAGNRSPRLVHRPEDLPSMDVLLSDLGILPGTWLPLSGFENRQFVELGGSIAVLFHESTEDARGERAWPVQP